MGRLNKGDYSPAQEAKNYPPEYWRKEASWYRRERSKNPVSGTKTVIPLDEGLSDLEVFWEWCEERHLQLAKTHMNAADDYLEKRGLLGYFASSTWSTDLHPSAIQSARRQTPTTSLACAHKIMSLSSGLMGGANGSRQLLWGPLPGMEVWEVAVKSDCVCVYALRPERFSRHCWRQKLTILDFVQPTRALNPVKRLLSELRRSAFDFPEFLDVTPVDREEHRRHPEVWDIAVSQLTDAVYVPVVPWVEGDVNGTMLNHYTVPSAEILDLIDRARLSFKLSEQEQAVVSLAKNVILIGRSGTGKTTCGVLRLWSQYTAFQEQAGASLLDDGAPRRLKALKHLEEADKKEKGEGEMKTDQGAANTSVTIEDYAILTDSDDDIDHDNDNENDDDDDDDDDDGTGLFDQHYWYDNAEEPGQSGVHPVFVTLSPVLCSEVSQYYKKLNSMYQEGKDADKDSGKSGAARPEPPTTPKMGEVSAEGTAGSSDTAAANDGKSAEDLAAEEILGLDEDALEEEMFADLPPSFLAMKDEHFPCFLTLRRFLLMLDGSLRHPFFLRSASGKITDSHGRTANWHPEGRGDMMIIRRYQATGAEAGLTEEDDDFFLDGSVFEAMDRRKAELERKRVVEYETCATEVDYYYYANHMHRHVGTKLHPSLVYTEIISVIKGSKESLESPTGYLTREQYLAKGRRKSLLGKSERQQIYTCFQRYRSVVDGVNYFDTQDVVKHIWDRLTIEGYRGSPIHYVCLDEVQDFTQATISLFFKVCHHWDGFFFTGDTCQTIARGIGFRFSDLRSLVSHHRGGDTTDIHQLTINYRSHSALLHLGNSVVSLLETLFPESIDKLAHDHGLKPGPKPVILDTTDTEELFRFLCGKAGTASNSKLEFGAQQVVIVRDEDAKHKLPDILKPALCLTVFEAKGLEFDDVILYNFWEDSPTQDEWRVLNNPTFTPLIEEIAARQAVLAQRHGDPKGGLVNVSTDLAGLDDDGGRHIDEHLRSLSFDPLQHNLLSSELKHLYVAITRARNRVFIFDSNITRRAPMLRFWLKANLVKVLRPGDDTPEEKFFNPTDTAQWLAQGRSMLRRGYYRAAKMCFDYAKQPRLTRHAQALLLASEAATYGYHVGDPVSGQIGPDNSNSSAMGGVASGHAKGKELYLQAAQLFEENENHVQAARCYLSAQDTARAAALFEQCGRWSDVGAAHAWGKRYEDAVTAYTKAGDLLGVMVNAGKLAASTRMICAGGRADPLLLAIDGTPMEKRGAEWADLRDKHTVAQLKRLRDYVANRDIVTTNASAFCQDVLLVVKVLGCQETLNADVTLPMVEQLSRLDFADIALQLLQAAERVAPEIDQDVWAPRLFMRSMQAHLIRRDNTDKVMQLLSSIQTVQARVEMALRFGLVPVALRVYQKEIDTYALAGFQLAVRFAALDDAVKFLRHIKAPTSVLTEHTRTFVATIADVLWDQLKLRAAHQQDHAASGKARKSPDPTGTTPTTGTDTRAAGVTGDKKNQDDHQRIDSLLDQVRQYQIDTQQHAHSTLALVSHVRGLVNRDSDQLHAALLDMDETEALYRARSLIAIGLFGGVLSVEANAGPLELALEMTRLISTVFTQSTSHPGTVLGWSAGHIDSIPGPSHLVMRPGHSTRTLRQHYIEVLPSTADRKDHNGPRGALKYPDGWNTQSRLFTFSTGAILSSRDAAVAAGRRSLLNAAVRAADAYLRLIDARAGATVLCAVCDVAAQETSLVPRGEWSSASRVQLKSLQRRTGAAVANVVRENPTMAIPDKFKPHLIEPAFDGIMGASGILMEEEPEMFEYCSGHDYVYDSFTLLRAAGRMTLFREYLEHTHSEMEVVPYLLRQHMLLARMHDADVAGDWTLAAEIALSYLNCNSESLSFTHAFEMVQLGLYQLMVMALGSMRLQTQSFHSPYIRDNDDSFHLPLSAWSMATYLMSEDIRDESDPTRITLHALSFYQRQCVNDERLTYLIHELASYLLYLFNNCNVKHITNEIATLLLLVARNGFLGPDACNAIRASLLEAGGFDDHPAFQTLYTVVDIDGDSILEGPDVVTVDAQIADLYSNTVMVQLERPGRARHSRPIPEVHAESRTVRRPGEQEASAFVDDSASQAGSVVAVSEASSAFSVIHHPGASSVASNASSSWTDGGLTATPSTATSSVGSNAQHLTNTSVDSVGSGFDLTRDLSVDDSAAIIIQRAHRRHLYISRIHQQFRARYYGHYRRVSNARRLGRQLKKAWRCVQPLVPTSLFKYGLCPYTDKMLNTPSLHQDVVPTFLPSLPQLQSLANRLSTATDAANIKSAAQAFVHAFATYKSQLALCMTSLSLQDRKIDVDFSMWLHSEARRLITDVVASVDDLVSARLAEVEQAAKRGGKGRRVTVSGPALTTVVVDATAEYQRRYRGYVARRNARADQVNEGGHKPTAAELKRQKARRRLKNEYVRAKKALLKSFQRRK